MSGLKVLTLVHESLVPPKKASAKEVAWADWKTEYTVCRALSDLGHDVSVVGVSDDLAHLQERIREIQPDIIFNLLEEFNGEPLYDQNIVSLLELLEVPYTGCCPQGLTLGRDKAVAKKILDYHGIPTARFQVFPMDRKFKTSRDLRFPMIVKSLIEEASLGISQDSVVRSEKRLRQRVEFIHRTLATDALVEEYIPGRELYVGVLGNDRKEVLPIWELEFGDLGKKSLPIATQRLKFNKDYCQKHGVRRGPARNIAPSVRKEIEDLCLKAYGALRLNGYARMDLRLTPEGEIYFLEVNPNPELARGEDLANAAQHAGISYSELIGRIIELGLSWNKVA